MRDGFFLSGDVHDEQTFAVTELCPGSPATILVRPDNHLRPDEVIAVGLQLAGALAAVHAAGVVYRDLHPGNVLIDRGTPTRAWLFDFDQAQVSADFYAALTERWATPPEERTEPKRGKPLQNMDHAAPELRAGAAFSAASDVYALGLLLYRLVTGRRPILSGGEPTMHPNYVDFIRLGRAAKYRKIQTVTNGRLFRYRDFLSKCLDAGLSEEDFEELLEEHGFLTEVGEWPVS